MYIMYLNDGTDIKFDGINGDNYITQDQKEIDTSVFTDDNLKKVTVTDEGGEVVAEYENLSFIQQQKQLNGDYYIAFRQKTDVELTEEERDEYVTNLEEAFAELYELLLQEG